MRLRGGTAPCAQWEHRHPQWAAKGAGTGLPSLAGTGGGGEAAFWKPLSPVLTWGGPVGSEAVPGSQEARVGGACEE